MRAGGWGLDTDQMVASAGIDRAALQDPDGRIPVEQVEALWRKAYELSNDPDLALHCDRGGALRGLLCPTFREPVV
jgi:hypothetical protein